MSLWLGLMSHKSHFLVHIQSLLGARPVAAHPHPLLRKAASQSLASKYPSTSYLSPKYTYFISSLISGVKNPPHKISEIFKYILRHPPCCTALWVSPTPLTILSFYSWNLHIFASEQYSIELDIKICSPPLWININKFSTLYFSLKIDMWSRCASKCETTSPLSH